MKISVILPAKNEAEGLRRTLPALARVLPEAEIIVVDDGSTDETAEVARAAGARVLSSPYSMGNGAAIKRGARAAQGDVLVFMDADGQHDPEDIPGLLARLEAGFDMVVGARQGRHYRGSPVKLPMRLLLRFLVEWTTGRAIPDINSGLRVFSRATAMRYFPHLCDTFSFTTSLTLAYMMTTRFVCYVPIDYAERIGRSHVQMWRDSLRTLQFIV